MTTQSNVTARQPGDERRSVDVIRLAGAVLPAATTRIGRDRSALLSAQVLARFAATARDEVELDMLTAELINVVQETLQPANVSVWLKKMDDRQ